MCNKFGNKLFVVYLGHGFLSYSRRAAVKKKQRDLLYMNAAVPKGLNRLPYMAKPLRSFVPDPFVDFAGQSFVAHTISDRICVCVCVFLMFRIRFWWLLWWASIAVDAVYRV